MSKGFNKTKKEKIREYFPLGFSCFALTISLIALIWGILK